MVAAKCEIDPVFPYGPPVCEGRLTLTSGTPVTITDVTGAGTLYLTPLATGSRISHYENGAWITRTFTEASFTLSGVSTASRPYDVFSYFSSGTLTLDLVVWTSDTARATALATQDGRYVKSGATDRLYHGTVWLNASEQAEDSDQYRYVWNYYNRVERELRRRETTASWTYTTASFREANGTTNVNEVAIINGLEGGMIEVDLLVSCSNTNAGVSVEISIGLNGSAGAQDLGPTLEAPASGIEFLSFARLKRYPAIGRHYYTWFELSSATGTTTWLGGGRTGLSGKWLA